MTRLSGWGRFPVVETPLVNVAEVGALVDATRRGDGFVARGNGRAYGDAAIGDTATLSMLGIDRMRGFDPETGLLTVEAGVLLGDVIAAFLPRGWFPAVVPGTRHVTIGGAIASDIHGKNHHKVGSFGDHVVDLVIVTAAGELLRASRDENAELFAATVGGMGLTGTIVEARIRLIPVESGWIRQTTVVADDLAASIAALDAGDDATYSVAWIDCLARGRQLGRSLIFLGEHARRDELDADKAARPVPVPAVPRLSVPVDFPSFALNRPGVAAFNELYFRAGARRAGAPFLIASGPYFFPLDGISRWNRIYGRRGFVQYQCVIPADRAPAVLAELLDRIARRGTASFLAVLKKLGPSRGLISFPAPGYTLALDFPLAQGLLGFLDEIDRLVVDAGGRLYLTKDARQSRATFDAGYTGADAFRELRRRIDPQARIRSRLSTRLGL